MEFLWNELGRVDDCNQNPDEYNYSVVGSNPTAHLRLSLSHLFEISK